MSIKKRQLYFYIFLILGVLIYQYFKPETLVRRSFSSDVNISQYSVQGLADRIINLRIKVVDQSEIVAEVSLPFDYSGELQYKWTLGQDVILKTGALTGHTTKEFTKDSIKKISIQVDGFKAEQLRHIGFEIWGAKNNKRIYADGLISSQQEKSFEIKVQKMENAKIKKMGLHK